ncbi:hypothetical protein V6N11_069731 [Hibiscus sabdariffa]|uniref:Uncharacterized protein n=1 Tax=Hibiscus sabdariffa TaxID=183260 RepID=A0ABR2Q3P3_9ROSI
MPRQRQRVLPGQLSWQIFRLRLSILLRYWLIPKSNNLLSCLYMISLGGKLSPLSPMSREYLPCKAISLLSSSLSVVMTRMMLRRWRLLAGDGWAGGSAAAGGSIVRSIGVSSRMTLAAGALRFRAPEDSAMLASGVGAKAGANDGG